ncbi:MFS transporter [Martelella alba]|uniref:MHS family MFS transporter n=1 Tax=Martelella alba TaxID=2590451 RepID=A0ABY2SKC6_9HYPH|nr:MFS transporter [Martelella alba]TKI05182.1 MHS family MFS transporter [Martelella alba]
MNIEGSQTTLNAVNLSSARDMRKVAMASAIGTMIEYYDFTLYTTATALVFNKIFFPSYDPLMGSLAAFTTYFVGYCSRPLGGVIFGHFGDRFGRKIMLLLTLMIMGIGTFLIGLIPPYAQIGVWAPIMLVILRILQGIGIGGEYGGGMTMMVEHAPAEKRGFYSSLVHIGVPAGFLVPIILIGVLENTLSPDGFLNWGWRIPFLLSLALLAVGIFIRFHIAETPSFKRVLQTGGRVNVPAFEAIRHHRHNMLFGIGAKVAESGLFNIYAVFAISYGVNVLKLPNTLLLNGVLLACFLECFTLPLFGALSDRFGKRTVYCAGMLFQAVLAYPFFLLLDSGSTPLIYLAIAAGLALGHGSVYGAQGAFFSALFPANIRYSGLSMVQQIGPILGGGISPLVATALLIRFGDHAMVTVYMAAIALLSALCALALRPSREDA